MATPPKPTPRQLTTPRAAALAGVLFALLFGAVLILIRTKMPEGATGSSEWLNSRGSGIVTAAKLMPFAGIAFLWFIGVVRDGLGRNEDKFFSSVFSAAACCSWP
jgi:ABC-type amino acid transport system permease subunit